MEQKKVLEAALFMAGRPLTLEELAKICGSGNIGLIRKDVDDLCEEYSKRNTSNNSSIIIQKSQDTYFMRVIPEVEEVVANLAPLPEISPAILKTLALIAYEQPITQSRIVKERGNRTYKYIKKLLKDEFITAEKYKRTKLLRTTAKFKDYFQIKSLEELKKIEVNLEKFNAKKKEKINV